MSESVTRFFQRSGGTMKWLVTLGTAVLVYYSGIELTKAKVEAQAVKLNKLEEKSEADHDILIELRSDMKILKDHLLRKRTNNE